jgi:High potential iron-sulfur protein
MKTRRQFIRIVPAAAGLSVLAACGQKEATPSAPVASAPAPAPAAPAPAPATPAPAPAASSAPAAAAPAPAGAAGGAMVDEKDPQAASLGYVADATKADKTKFASYAAGQACSSCALYQGAAGAEAGGCGIFAGKQVSAKGWCSAYNKKG